MLTAVPMFLFTGLVTSVFAEPARLVLGAREAESTSVVVIEEEEGRCTAGGGVADAISGCGVRRHRTDFSL
ncbi:hypothetical protein [Nonomuraea sp. KM90]|uniref:hypothetical protein n=1 Tax=Nonomuraea sp. KM90 TaxID=3457428 RepID=UPI003FCCC819